MNFERRSWGSLAGLTFIFLVCRAEVARSFDFFGLFGDSPPSPSQDTLPYAIAFEIPAVAEASEQDLKDASSLYRLRQNSPADGPSLYRRAQADLNPLLDALWGAGFFNATVHVYAADVEIREGGSSAAIAAAVEDYRGRKPVPVKIVVEPGQLFTLRKVRVLDAGSGRAYTRDELPQRQIKLEPGSPASSAQLRGASASIVDHFRSQSYPLAKMTKIKPVVFHELGVVDATFHMAMGQKAPFGDVALTGKSDVDPAVVRSYIYVERGDPYSPAVLADIRKSVQKIPAISSLRLREAPGLDAQGMLQLSAEVTDRKMRVVGFGARYSTLDGPALHTYWQHRNLFGGAESLRLEGDLFVPPRNTSSVISTFKDFRPSDLGGRLKASFVKPALQGTRNDLLVDALVERDRTGGDIYGGYSSDRVVGTAAIRHRFNDKFSAQAGVEYERGRTEDSIGRVDYTLVGIPLSVNFDSTDRLLDPTQGFRVSASLTPYPSFLGSTAGIVQSSVRASTYYALDENAHYILAGRVGLGSIVGSDLADIPATHRFYAGGGGSVRGFRYRGLSPLGPTGQVTGGRSLTEASFEARIKVTDAIGIVPFFDMGGAFESSYPDFKEELRYAAGLGLRYYTGIGPIRLDFAVPINKRSGDQAYAIYFGIGESF